MRLTVPRRLVASWGPPLLIVILVLAGGFGWYGSANGLVAAVRGKSVIADFPQVTGDWKPGDQAKAGIGVTNLTSSPITVTGARFGCNCVGNIDFPVSLPPRGRVEIPIDIRIGQTETKSFSVSLYTDSEKSPEVIGTISYRCTGKATGRDS